MRKLTYLARSFLKVFNIGIMKHDAMCQLLEGNYKNQSASHDIEFLLTLPAEYSSTILKHLKNSKSQLRQDLFVLSHLNWKRGGFFVDVGATNGVELSNSWLMEKEFAWIGILAEPARCWHQDLKKNRTSFTETSCVWKESNLTLLFNETPHPELSTIDTFSASDFHRRTRKTGKKYQTKTISINDMLEKYNAPKEIEYLSLDTEGSEFEILSVLDFSKYSFRVITCEHNYSPMRETIFNLLTRHGYRRVYQHISLWDDWYIK